MRKRMMNETPADTAIRLKKEAREIEKKGLAVPVAEEPKPKPAPAAKKPAKKEVKRPAKKIFKKKGK